MKLVIAGSRTIHDYECLINAIDTHIRPVYGNDFEIISGGAKGVDQLAIRWAHDNNLKYQVLKPLYQHNKDRTAPLRRNQDMAREGDVLLALWDQQSTGTAHMITCMKKLNKPVFVVHC